jgi:hypothetical protein
MTTKKGFHYRKYEGDGIHRILVPLNHETLVVNLIESSSFAQALELTLRDGGLVIRGLNFGISVDPHCSNVVVVKPRS